MWFMHDGGGWWMVIGGLLMLLLWGGVITLVVLGITRLAKHLGGGTITAKQCPIDIIRERYARGEITKEQFEQMKRDLN